LALVLQSYPEKLERWSVLEQDTKALTSQFANVFDGVSHEQLNFEAVRKLNFINLR